jgi:hypothetical protein
MDRDGTTVSREQFYGQIWTIPMTKLDQLWNSPRFARKQWRLSCKFLDEI